MSEDHLCLFLCLRPAGSVETEGIDWAVVDSGKAPFLISHVIFFFSPSACFHPSWASSTVHTGGELGAVEVVSRSHSGVLVMMERLQGAWLGSNPAPPYGSLKAHLVGKGQRYEHAQLAAPGPWLLQDRLMLPCTPGPALRLWDCREHGSGLKLLQEPLAQWRS